MGGLDLKEIKTILSLVILILYLIVTPMIMWCRIKGNKELEGSLKLFILTISIIGIALANI